MSSAKTNALRLLESAGIAHRVYEYPVGGEHVDGETVARLIGKEPRTVYKTLVARGASKAMCVFAVQASGELNLKKAAAAAGEKSVALVKLDEITPLTGYVRGGCSPVGMKKKYRTFIDASAEALPLMIVSAGKRGLQVECAPADLASLCGAQFAELQD